MTMPRAETSHLPLTSCSGAALFCEDLVTVGLSEGKFIGGFERGSANAADDGGAVAADEGIVYLSGTVWAPQADFFASGWIQGRVIVHAEDERSMSTFSANARDEKCVMR